MTTQSRLIELFCYDKETGIFTHRARRRNVPVAGVRAGTVRADGYVSIRVDGLGPFLGHRLAWLYCNGVWPSKFLDHINGNPSDNSLANLREASPSENSANSRRRKHNRSGFKGVYCENGKRWVAQIRFQNKRTRLGRFKTAEAAYAAYCAAAQSIQGDFSRIS